MNLAELHLRQRDGVSCGPVVAVVAGALLDPAYRARLSSLGRAGTDWEQGRVHHAANRIWPRALGTTPSGLAGVIGTHGVPYRWRFARSTAIDDVERALASHLPVAMLVGNVLPRHWVLVVEVVGETWHCYEPSSGEVRTVTTAAVRAARLTGLGYPRAFALVLPAVTDTRHSNI